MQILIVLSGIDAPCTDVPGMHRDGQAGSVQYKANLESPQQA